MNSFWKWEGWTAVSSICQILIMLFAFIAIMITIKQISGKSNAKINASLKFGWGAYRCDGGLESVPGINISIANLGMAPVFISECGIEFLHSKTLKPGILVTGEPFVLQSGECVDKSMPYIQQILSELDNEVSLHDKARIYVTCGTGKTYYSEIKFDYAGFKFEYEKILKRTNKTMKQNKDG